MVLTAKEKAKLRRERFKGMKELLFLILDSLVDNNIVLPIGLTPELEDVFNWVDGERYRYNKVHNYEQQMIRDRKLLIEKYGERDFTYKPLMECERVFEEIQERIAKKRLDRILRQSSDTILGQARDTISNKSQNTIGG